MIKSHKTAKKSLKKLRRTTTILIFCLYRAPYRPLKINPQTISSWNPFSMFLFACYPCIYHKRLQTQTNNCAAMKGKATYGEHNKWHGLGDKISLNAKGNAQAIAYSTEAWSMQYQHQYKYRDRDIVKTNNNTYLRCLRRVIITIRNRLPLLFLPAYVYLLLSHSGWRWHLYWHLFWHWYCYR